MTVVPFNLLIGIVALIFLQLGAQARPSSQLSKAKALLQNEQKFCKKLLNGQTPDGITTVFKTIPTVGT